MSKTLFLSPLLLLLVSSLPSPAAPPASHPLDPLTPGEMAKAARILREAGKMEGDARFVYLNLKEPDKREVLQWKRGMAIERAAAFVLRRDHKVYEGAVDLSENKVTGWVLKPGAQPRLLFEEFARADEIIKSDPGWREAMRKRGLTDFSKIRQSHYSAGYFGDPAEKGRRLIHAVSFDESKVSNFWGRPIEGVFVVVDLDAGKVVRLVDTGVVPIPETEVDFDEQSAGKTRTVPTPVELRQKRGPSFTIAGHFVSWQKWNFHFRIDPRVGLVLSLVSYEDGGEKRSILYQASLSELFVPYMDPSVSWYSRTFFDIGEYGLGLSLSTLEPGSDCPRNASLLDAVFSSEIGNPEVYKNVLAVFERTAGNPAWRHYNFSDETTESRKSRELVVRTIATLGNYDYLFDWIFQQNGALRVAVGSTGVDAVKAVEARTRKEDPAGKEDAYGRFIDEHIVAVNHDHFFNFRLDLDVDGIRNSLEKDRLKPSLLPEKNPRRSLWVVDAVVAATESEAKLRISLEKPVIWRIINPNVLTPLGYPVSFRIKPGANAVSLLDPGDYPQQRAGFTDYHLWVTPYRAEERHAAGNYVFQSTGREGLPQWTSADRNIENTDIVAWYTLGFHHLVRAEDWPVMPLTWAQFELLPFDFFKRNPALDLPAKP